MGFSPGVFYDNELGELHWEMGSNHRAKLYNYNELKIFVELDLEEARKCASYLQLLIDMADRDGL